MKKCVIFYNSNNNKNIEILKKITRVLKSKKISLETVCVIDKCPFEIKADFAVSIGGDGTVLYASHYLVEKGIPLISVKAGGLGFLSSIEVSEAEDFIKLYLKEEYKMINRSLLKINYKKKHFIALNDLVIKSKELRTFYTDIYYLNDYVSTYFSDGIIVSTPTGSTAYNLSSGGPIIHPHSKVMVVTPISPHTLTHRPVVLPDTSLIKIYAREKYENHGGIVLSIDGQENMEYDMSAVEISVYEKFLKTIVPKKYSYFEVLRKKLSWGERDD